jgi:hypothetical protein
VVNAAQAAERRNGMALTDYLLARIAEEEAVARGAAAGKYMVQSLRSIVASDPLP